MRTLLIVLALAGCSDDPKPVDAAPDTPVVTLDCPSYCTEIQAHCTGANAQYAEARHCLGACPSFAMGSTINASPENTLGCRIYQAGDPAKMAPAAHCAQAGPGGDQITASPPAFCSGGDICASFCALEIKACGSLDAPLPGNPRDGTGNPIYQYLNMGSCMTACARLDKTHVYSPAARGNSLACRLNAAVRAAVAVMPDGAMHCPDTASAAVGECAGAASP